MTAKSFEKQWSKLRWSHMACNTSQQCEQPVLRVSSLFALTAEEVEERRELLPPRHSRIGALNIPHASPNSSQEQLSQFN